MKNTKAAPKKPSSAEKTPKKGKSHLLLSIIGWLFTFGLLYWIFVIKLPALVDVNEVKSTVQSLSLAENIALVFGGLLTVWAVGWTAATVLPGLSVKKGTQASVVGQLTSVALPPPIDMVIRFSMYKSYGFSVDNSAIAVAVAGIARYFTVVAIPVMGLGALLLTGQGDTSALLWFLGGSVLIVVALWITKQVIKSKRAARRLGRILQKPTNWVQKLFRKPPSTDIEKRTVKFGSNLGNVAITHFKSVSISNIAWGLASFVAFFMAVRFCGVDASAMSASYILFITGCMLLLNAFPITPGGVGVTETILLSVMSFPSAQVESAFTAALFVYRVYTWLLPMPIGAVVYFVWRRQIKNGTLAKPI